MNKTIKKEASGKITKDYQIISMPKKTSIICLNDKTLELRNWKGERLTTRLLSKSPSFIKTG